MVEELMRDFAVSATILGNLSAFYFYSYASIQIPIGVLLDRYGPRRLMTGAAALVAAGCALFATSDSISGAYLGRLLIGAGCAFSWVGALAVIGQWLPPQRFYCFFLIKFSTVLNRSHQTLRCFSNTKGQIKFRCIVF
jgi:MFS family permease